MMRNRLAWLLSLILVIAMMMSLSVTAFAAERCSADFSASFSSVQSCITRYIAAQKTAITKTTVRAQLLAAVAAGRSLNCDTAADMLCHSLSDCPGDLSYDSSTKYARQILNSSECAEIISAFKTAAGGNSQYTMTGTIALNSTLDLYLAYNNINYSVSGTRTGDVWNLTITFTDIYDFSARAWGETLSLSSVVTAINNYAVYAQSVQAVVPYRISVTVQTTCSA